MFYVKKDAINRAFRKRCVEKDGSPVDLTTAESVNFVMVDENDTLKVNALASVVDAKSGEVEYSWGTGDTDTVGDFKVEIHVTFPGAKLEIFPSYGYEVVKVEKNLI